MDESLVYVLVCCLEAAMKRNGDVRLAGLPAGARALLVRIGISRLFEIFNTTAEAVSSFGRRPFHPALPDVHSPLSTDRESETAA
jgi:hypothetical protein